MTVPPFNPFLGNPPPIQAIPFSPPRGAYTGSLALPTAQILTWKVLGAKQRQPGGRGTDSLGHKARRADCCSEPRLSFVPSTETAPGTQVGTGQKATARAPWPLVNCVTLDRSRPLSGPSAASRRIPSDKALRKASLSGLAVFPHPGVLTQTLCPPVSSSGQCTWWTTPA